MRTDIAMSDLAACPKVGVKVTTQLHITFIARDSRSPLV